ncbi:MAG: aldehyde dehydrogenase family protein, partial [Rhodospirillaceae bacterium]|nr:aldehyde dehydrogenase family protein [Rhodospirillaceae bacterium]
MTKQINNAIDGKIVPATSGRTAEVFNPATGEVTSIVGLSSKSDVDVAVAAAKKAFPEWANTPPLKRNRYMFKFKEL